MGFYLTYLLYSKYLLFTRTETYITSLSFVTIGVTQKNQQQIFSQLVHNWSSFQTVFSPA